MSRKEEYKEKNLLYLDEIASEEGIRTLPCGILYKVIQAGTGKVSPNRESVVSVHYKGTLINGREFDNSWKRGCPEAFRLNQVIEGWQLALQEMRVGVGSKKYPFVPILWPPHSSLAPCWIALSTFFSIDSNALASISGPISRSATSLGFPTFTCFMPATSFSMKVSFIALST